MRKAWNFKIHPRQTNIWEKRHHLQLKRLPTLVKNQGLLLELSIVNERGTWSTDVILEPDEVATLMRGLAEHMEMVTFVHKATEVLEAV
jgi:hypothetical protein